MPKTVLTPEQEKNPAIPDGWQQVKPGSRTERGDYSWHGSNEAWAYCDFSYLIRFDKVIRYCGVVNQVTIE